MGITFASFDPNEYTSPNKKVILRFAIIGVFLIIPIFLNLLIPQVSNFSVNGIKIYESYLFILVALLFLSIPILLIAYGVCGIIKRSILYGDSGLRYTGSTAIVPSLIYIGFGLMFVVAYYLILSPALTSSPH